MNMRKRTKSFQIRLVDDSNKKTCTRAERTELVFIFSKTGNFCV